MKPVLANAAEAEGALISAFALNPTRVGALVFDRNIVPEHFRDPNKATIFAHQRSAWLAGESVDLISITRRVRESGREIPPGDMVAIFHSFPTAEMAEQHADDLLSANAAVRLRALGERIVENALTTNPEEFVSEIRAELEAICQTRQPEDTAIKTHLLAALAFFENIADPAGALEFGLGLDESAGPFCPGDLIIVAAETGKGKSALAGTIMANVAQAGARCVMFTLEMEAWQIAERLIAARARVDTRTLKLNLRRFGMENPTEKVMQELSRIHGAVSEIAKLPIDIVRKCQNATDILAKIRQLHAANPVRLVVADYAQLIEGNRRDGDNREREVASISRSLKMLASELGFVCIVLSQLNDGGKLRESRALGHDANCVLFIEEEDKEHIIRVGKARSAPTGTEIKVRYSGPFTKFEPHNQI